jgi:hypothetical protein
MPPPGPLGFIVPSRRTQAQQDAHARALAKMPRFSMAPVGDLPVGTKVMLTDFWKAPEVVADIGGQPFTGFGQYTGSCVGVSEGNAVFTVGAVQRLLDDAPTKAFIPWWPFPYGRTRYNEGDRGQGEGAVDSVMGETLVEEGFFDITQPGLPAFGKTGPDGWWLTAQLEYQWSDGGAIGQKWKDAAKPHAGMTKAVVADVMGIRTANVNGYPVLDGCNNYVGNGSIKGSGDTAYVAGRYDGRGGHSTCFLGVWHHPTAGYLYLYSNQWPTSTYPRDPAGGGRCCVWLPEAEVEKLFRTGGDRGETMALSRVPWFPVQVDKILDWSKV